MMSSVRSLRLLSAVKMAMSARSVAILPLRGLFRGVAVASASDYTHQLSLHQGAKHAQHFFECRRRVGKIHVYGRQVVMAGRMYPLQPAGHAPQSLQRFNDRLAGDTESKGHRSR